MTQDFDALLLDLDGTLLDSSDGVHPETAAALAEARAAGVHVMVVTERSKITARPVLHELELDTATSIFNGAAVYCPREDRMLEERTLSNRSLERILDYTHQTGDLAVFMTADRKFAFEPASDEERSLLWDSVEIVTPEDFRPEYVIRTTFLCSRLPDSRRYAEEIEAHVGHPLYTTHFPLAVLPRFRASSVVAVDVHPPCRGKAEALRHLEEVHGISPERVVAVGDATNDIPMIEAAGLGVAMESGMEELRAVADRVIGHHDGPALGQFVRELLAG